MAQPNAKNGFTLEIAALSYGPYGIGRRDGRVIMVPGTVPGDKLDARIVALKENYAIGEVVRLLSASPSRQNPPCPYVGECGGCPWQHIRYEAQLAAKQKNVEDALRRIGNLHDFEVRQIIPAPREYHYRRRIRLQVNKDKHLGFYRPSSHDLVEIDSCLIAEPQAEARFDILRRWVFELHTSIDQIEVVHGDIPDEIVVVVRARGPFIPRDEPACKSLLNRNIGICGLVFTGAGWRRNWGDGKITVSMEDSIHAKVDGDVFTQINREGNQRILHELLCAGSFNGSDDVLELYCGAGNFTLPVAQKAREVVAVEAYRPAIESGKQNAQLNDLSNIRWIVAHVPAAVQRLRQHREKFSKIVLDPPRAGAKGIERDLASLGAETIFYVSCNPTTLARDLAGLAKHGYRLNFVQPIDLFPHTFHVETLAVMNRN